MQGAGGLLVLLAISVLLAIFVVVSLENDETHLNDRDVPYVSAVAGGGAERERRRQ